LFFIISIVYILTKQQRNFKFKRIIMMIKERFVIGVISCIIAIAVSSCGGGGSNVGQGGPDVSPDQYTGTDKAITDTANTTLTGTTTATEGTIIETAVDTKIEGTLDTNTGDTGLIDAGNILDGTTSGTTTS
jgi:hypothetical protein